MLWIFIATVPVFVRGTISTIGVSLLIGCFQAREEKGMEAAAPSPCFLWLEANAAWVVEVSGLGGASGEYVFVGFSGRARW